MANGKTSNKAIIADVAQQYGIPSYIPLNIAEFESSYNNEALGDHGTSFGLFQLHIGGLAPKGATKDQLYDPAYNANVAIKNMIPSYNLGVQQGLSGFDLLQFVANRSGWPGRLGVDWTNKNRPDYTAGLKKAYANDSAETSNSVEDRTPWATPESPPTYIDGSTDFDSTNPGAVFHAINDNERLKTWNEWFDSKKGLDKLNPANPFIFLLDNGAAIGFRATLIVIGLALILLGAVRVAFAAKEKTEDFVELG